MTALGLSGEQAGAESPLVGNWQVEAVRGVDAFNSSKTMFEVDADERLATTVGCNWIVGAPILNGDRVSFGAMAATRRGCPGGNRDGHATGRPSFAPPFYWVMVLWLVNPVREHRPHRSGHAAVDHGDCVVGDFDGRRRIRDYRSRPSVRRPVHNSERRNAPRARHMML